MLELQGSHEPIGTFGSVSLYQLDFKGTTTIGGDFNGQLNLPFKDIKDLSVQLISWIEIHEALESGTSSHDDITEGYDSGSAHHDR